MVSRLSGCVLLLLFACGDDGADLVVDLRTDIVPGVELDTVDTLLDPVEGGGMRTVPVDSHDDLVTGARIGEFPGLAPGVHTVRVFLRRADGAVVASRTTRVVVQGDIGLTVVISRACREVVCPATGDAADRTECFGGRCVRPECSPIQPEVCGAPMCATDASCASAIVPCASARCVEGVCLVSGVDALCSTGERCDPEVGCTTELPDAGTGADAGPSADGGPGMDGGTGADGGPSVDGGPAPLDGGPRDAGCAVNGCPADVPGTWGTCVGTAPIGDCDQTGVRSRPVMHQNCTGGDCVPATVTEMEGCVADRSGVACAAGGRCWAGSCCQGNNCWNGSACVPGASDPMQCGRYGDLCQNCPAMGQICCTNGSPLCTPPAFCL